MMNLSKILSEKKIFILIQLDSDFNFVDQPEVSRK